MPLKEFLWPVKIDTFKSEFNDEVEVMRFMGQYRLDMGGLTQSGEIIESILGKGLKKLLPKDFHPKKILILGFGAGSGTKVAAKKWPGVQLTGVEIDPVVIKIGKKYFNTLAIPNLKIVNDDATHFIDQTKRVFDLVVIDCYQGYKIPPRLQTVPFIKKVKAISKYIIINRLFWGEHQAPSLKFLSRLRTAFTVNTTRTASNLLLGIG